MVVKNNETDVKKAIATATLVIGADKTIKELQKGKITKVFLTSNCASAIKESITYYCKLSKIPCEQIKEDDAELGIMCKKQFSISVMGVLKSK